MTFFGPDIRNGLPIGLGSVAGFGRRAFTPSVLFAAGEQGFWYDPSDLSSMYQDSAGTTPVTAVEQAVGLILDKSKGLVIGSDLVTNGTFDTNTTGWTAVNTPTLSVGANGVTIQNNGATSGILYQALTCVSGRTYQVSVKITYGGVGFARCEPSTVIPASVGGTVINASASGTYSFVFVATATTVYIVIGNRSDNNASHTYDNISVRELAGNHAIQPGATNRPILRSRYNLLTFSEDITNAAWTKSGITVTGNAGVAPDGTTTADRMTAGAVGYYLQGIATLNGTTVPVTATIRIKNEDYTSSDQMYVNVSDGVTGFMQILFKPSDGTFTTPAPAASWSNVTRTVASIGGGWWLLTLSGTTTQWGSGWMEVGVTTAHNRACLVWGHDIRRSNDTIYPYQRINAATDYDTVGFPVYLAFDGSDDSLYTGGSIDFSATDKVTLWAGVTKLSDAAVSMLVELSASSAVNPGAFYFLAPNGAATAGYQFRSGGSANANVDSTSTFAAPITNVMTGIGDISGDISQIRVDGALNNTNTGDQGTGNYGSYPFYIGRRNNASLPFNGRLYQLIGRGAATSAALITQAERWVAGKQGRAL